MDVFVFTNIVAAYRVSFFNFIGREHNLVVFTAKTTKGVSITPVTIADNFKINPLLTIGTLGFEFHFFNPRFLLMFLKSNGIFIFDGNIRHISYLILSIILILGGKNCYVWSSDNHRSVTRFPVFFR